MNAASTGKLYLVPAPLDFGCEVQAPLQDVIPLGTLQIAATLPCWICENAKSTRAYLKRVGEVLPLLQPVQALQ
ncbi:MAG: ribosomal RNA small subunit methyltransferase I, partial [Polaromonas sp.]|nr:ribosomal RNA small subunit methyltransferase I [Polaromonas sp.]